MMRPIKLFTDSTSDLPEETVKQHGIAIIPLYVNFGTQSYKDNVDIKPAELFRKVEETGKLPMTSAPTTPDFVDGFKKYIDQGMDILHISISSKISASYQNACTAAEQFPEGRVRAIDSLNLSSGIGFSVMNAVDCIEKGMSLDETYEAVQSAVPKVRSKFLVDTVEYLHKGGRCSGLQMLLSSLLEIHPILAVDAGSIRVAAKVRGNRQTALHKLYKEELENIDRVGTNRLIITNCECAEDVLPIKARFAELNAIQEILLANASCVIASHCGPRTAGFFYQEN